MFVFSAVSLTNPASLYANTAENTLAKPGIQHNSPLIKPELWISESGLTQNATSLIDNIRQLEREGLSPDGYYLPQLEAISKSEGLNYKQGTVSRIMDQAFLKLTRDLGRGTVNPQETQKQWFRKPPKINSAKLLEFLSSGAVSVEDVLKSIRPTDPAYEKLGAALIELTNQKTEWNKIPGGEKLEAGIQSERVAMLKRRLIASGDLSASTSLDTDFTPTLAAAVINFQERHGLEADGIVAKSTLAALNVPKDVRIDQIKLNLERMRWMPRDTDGLPKIVVNIPEFKLHMYNGGEEIFELPVVTGKPKHQTPVFSETMKKIVVAPTWVVPTSITNNELIPLEKRKPGYLEKENIGFYYWSKGKLKPVSRSQVTRETLNQKPFPYVLQQSSGEKNVLGRVKFLMPNKYNIYLHDTSSRKLFQKNRRAFSHGCVRVSSPELLGSVLLQMDGYDQSEASALLAKTDTTTVRLKTAIQTDLVYYTSWVDKDGKLQFREDIYKHDKRLSNALKGQQKRLIAKARKMGQPTMAAALPIKAKK